MRAADASVPEAAITDGIVRLTTLAPDGFAVALHVRYQTPTYLFQTYPSAWREEYSREGLVMRDPIVAWGFAGTGAPGTSVATWAELARHDPGEVFARARAHGLAHGLALRVERGDGRSFAGFARRDRDFSAEEARQVVAATEALHDLLASKTPISAATRTRMRRLSVAFTHT